jgi:hypothetical protein
MSLLRTTHPPFLYWAIIWNKELPLLLHEQESTFPDKSGVSRARNSCVGAFIIYHSSRYHSHYGINKSTSSQWWAVTCALWWSSLRASGTLAWPGTCRHATLKNVPEWVRAACQLLGAVCGPLVDIRNGLLLGLAQTVHTKIRWISIRRITGTVFGNSRPYPYPYDCLRFLADHIWTLLAATLQNWVNSQQKQFLCSFFWKIFSHPSS